MRRRIFGTEPTVDATAWVAPTATLIGDVELRARASVFYGAVLRADRDRIVIGAGSNLQDNVTVHGDPGSPTIVGRGVSVGHAAVLHGAVIGDESLVAAGAVVLEGTVVPPRSLVAGVPAKVRRELSDDEVAAIRRNAETYLMLSSEHAGIDDSPA